MISIARTTGNKLALVAGVAILLAALHTAPAEAAGGQLKVTVPVVEGAGIAVVYEGACGERGVIDAGTSSKQPVLDVLGDNPNVKWVSPSHYDIDHLADVDDLLKHLNAAGSPVQTVYDRGGDRFAKDSGTYGAYYDYVAAAGAPERVSVDIGQVFTLCGGTADEVTFTVVSAGTTDDTAAEGVPVSEENPRSLCLHVEFQDFDMATCGDIYRDVERAVAPLIGDVEFAVVNHHGSRTSSDQHYVDRLSPEAVVPAISALDGNHPLPYLMGRWEDNGDVYVPVVPAGGSKKVEDGRVVLTTTGFDVFGVRTEGPTPRSRVYALDEQPAAAVNISNVVGDAPGSDSQYNEGEYVELRNDGRETVPVGDFRIRDHAGHELAIGSGYTIAPGATLRVYPGAGDNTSSRYYNNGGIILNNGGDVVRLYRGAGIQLDVSAYNRTPLEIADVVESGGGEHVVLRNNGNTTYDVTGWYVSDASGNVIRIPSGYNVPPGGLLRLYPRSGANTPDKYFRGGDYMLDNGGDEVYLFTPQGYLGRRNLAHDSFRYGASNIRVDHVAADVSGSDIQPENGEHVRLKNDGEKHVDVSGWYLVDRAGNQLNVGSGYSIPPGETLNVYTASGTNTESRYYNNISRNVLDNLGDDVRLFKPVDDPAEPDTQMDHHYYGASQVFVAGVVANVPGGDLAYNAGEHVRLRNLGHADVNVSGWYLMDLAGNRLDIGSNYVLRAGSGILRVYTGDGDDTSEAFFNGRTGNVLNNTGEEVRLFTASGVEISSGTYEP